MIPAPPRNLDLASRPTELRLLKRASKALGGPNLWLKCDDMTGSVVSGNKIRKLEFLLAEALALGCDTVLTCGGLQSNHCRATAAVCARLGINCHLLLRGSPDLPEQTAPFSVEQFAERKRSIGEPAEADGNFLIDTLCGAQISIYSPKNYRSSLQQHFEYWQNFYVEKGGRSYSIPTGGSNALGLWGYIKAAEELVEDFERCDIAPEAVVCASGSGGTQGGLTLGLHLLESKTRVLGIAVCDSAEYFRQKIMEDVDGWQRQFMPTQSNLSSALNIETLEEYIGPGYAIGYDALFETIRWLAQTEGVVLDPVYTGKAFHGLLQEIKNGRFAEAKDIVFLHSGGLYGLFPYKSEFR